MKKAVIVFSGGVDSVCAVSFLKSRYELYGITFSYGQKANSEILAAKSFAKKLCNFTKCKRYHDKNSFRITGSFFFYCNV